MKKQKSNQSGSPIQVIDDEPFTTMNKFTLIIAISIPLAAIMLAL